VRVVSHLAVSLLDLVARSLPPRALRGLADVAGGLLWAASPMRRRVVDENLRIAFGTSLDAHARRRIGRASCRGLARVVAEVAAAEQLVAAGGSNPGTLHFLGSWDDLEAELRAGRGAIIVTAHLGNWELGAFAVRSRGIRLRAMARPLSNAVLEAWLERRRGGAERLIPKAGGLKDALRTLAGGGCVALLADQNAGRHGLFVPFFGLDASTYPTPAALAVRLGAPLFLGVCLRRPRSEGFDVHLERLPVGAEVAPVLLDLNRRLEGWIRRAPEQYNWIHRRWKTRPPGQDRSEPGQPSYARLWPANHPRTGLR